jgi:hypothetical protein
MQGESKMKPRERKVDPIMDELLSNINSAIIAAALVLDLEGVDVADIEEVYEGIYHCGTCTVRSVMEVIYPSIEACLDYLELEKDTK